MPVRGSWRGLALSQAINFIVHHDNSDINIAQCGVDKVACTDTEHVTVAADCHNGQVWSRHFHALGKRQRTPMHAVNTKGLHEVWETAGATNARYHHRLVWWQFEACQAAIGSVEYSEVTATRTPRRLYFAFKIFWCEIDRCLYQIGR